MIEIDPVALRAAREAKAMSRERLASRAGISERTLGRLETSGGRVRALTVECLAKPLGVEPHAIMRARPIAPKAPAEPPPPPPKRSAREPSALEAAVAAEAAAANSRRVRTTMGALDVVGAKCLQDLYTAYATREGETFAVAGFLETQRGLSVAEAKLLGTRSGVGARFHVVCEVAPGVTIGVTVHTATAAHTKKLQARIGRTATIVARVFVVPGEPEGGAAGFAWFLRERPGPWTLVVVEIDD